METHTEACVYREGKNVEEALQAACDALSTTPNQVEYEVVESGRGGVLGFLKGRQVKIRVWEKSATQRLVAEIVKELFAKMQLNVEINVTRGEDAYEINLETSDSDGLLIGRGGDTLKALQHLISRMVGHQDESARVRVDVAGYRKRRQDQLCRKARDLAERALSMGRDIMTEPLPADERRIVHLALAEDDRVETRAVGEGQIKRVAVCSASGRSERPRGGRRSPMRQGRGGGNGSGRRERDDRGNRGGRGRSNRTPREEFREDRNSDRNERGNRSAKGEHDDNRSRGRSSRDSEYRGRGSRANRDSREGAGANEPNRVNDRAERSPRRPPRTRPGTKETSGERRSERSRQTTPAAPRPDESHPAKSPAAQESYFNIPATVDSKEADPGDDKNGEDAPLTFGRRRRPGRGRR